MKGRERTIAEIIRDCQKRGLLANQLGYTDSSKQKELTKTKTTHYNLKFS